MNPFKNYFERQRRNRQRKCKHKFKRHIYYQGSDLAGEWEVTEIRCWKCGFVLDRKSKSL